MLELLEQIKAVLWEFISGYGKVIAWAIAIFVVGLLVISIITKAVRKTRRRAEKSITLPLRSSLPSCHLRRTSSSCS